MSEQLLPELDDPPSTGKWTDHTDLVVTDGDAAAGNALGRAIDVEDDDDNGLDQ